MLTAYYHTGVFSMAIPVYIYVLVVIINRHSYSYHHARLRLIDLGVLPLQYPRDHVSTSFSPLPRPFITIRCVNTLYTRRPGRRQCHHHGGRAHAHGTFHYHGSPQLPPAAPLPLYSSMVWHPPLLCCLCADSPLRLTASPQPAVLGHLGLPFSRW